MTTCNHNPYWRTVYDNCMACRAEQAEQRVAQLEGALRDLQAILTASIVVGQYRETLLRIVQQALQPPAPMKGAPQ